jgi:protein SCO1
LIAPAGAATLPAMSKTPGPRRLRASTPGASRRVVCLLSAATAIALASSARGQEAGNDAAADPHAAHRAMMTQASSEATYRVNQAEYTVPDLVLQDEQGKSVRLRQLFSGDRPVAVNFIFTSCTTICPVMTATMLQLQRELADQPDKPLFVSISIDPDYDTAAMLGAYAKKFGADWTFLTGERADVLAVLQSFSAWRGSKTNHAAITLFRAPHAGHWTRVEGLASAKQLADVWRDNVS